MTRLSTGGAVSFAIDSAAEARLVVAALEPARISVNGHSISIAGGRLVRIPVASWRESIDVSVDEGTVTVMGVIVVRAALDGAAN